MNILPHKSWHVRNKDNIERVRKDEEKARLEEEEKAKRAALADQEARTAFLRTKARAGLSKESSKEHETGSELVEVKDEPRHINFFHDIEEGLRQGSNPEYEAEKKAEQEKQEKAIGLLTYLGQSASSQHGEKPWYEKTDKQNKTEGERDVRDSKRKDSMDPLSTMKKFLTAKEICDTQDEKNHRKDKKKKKKKEERPSKKKSIEELRAERLKRESGERARERNLMSSSTGEKTQEIEDNPYRYNSQFNPDLVRKPRHTGHQRYKPY